MSDRMDDMTLLAYIEDELSPAERRAVEAQLAAEPKLLAVVEAMRRDRQMLRALPRQTAPADLVDRVTRQLERATLLGPADAAYDMDDDCDAAGAAIGSDDEEDAAARNRDDVGVAAAASRDVPEEPVIATIAPGPASAHGNGQGQPVVVVRMSRWLRWTNYAALAALLALGVSVTWRMISNDGVLTNRSTSTSPSSSATAPTTEAGGAAADALDRIAAKADARDGIEHLAATSATPSDKALGDVAGGEHLKDGAYAAGAGRGIAIKKGGEPVDAGAGGANVELAVTAEKAKTEGASQPLASKAADATGVTTQPGALGGIGLTPGKAAAAQKLERADNSLAAKAGPMRKGGELYEDDDLALQSFEQPVQRVEVGVENQYAALTPAEPSVPIDSARRAVQTERPQQFAGVKQELANASESLKKVADPASRAQADPGAQAKPAADAPAADSVNSLAESTIDADTAPRELAELAQQLASPAAPPAVRVEVVAADPIATRDAVVAWAATNKLTYYDDSSSAALAQVNRAADAEQRQLREAVRGANDNIKDAKQGAPTPPPAAPTTTIAPRSNTAEKSAAAGQAPGSAPGSIPGTAPATAPTAPNAAKGQQGAITAADKQVEQLARQRAVVDARKEQTAYGDMLRNNVGASRQVVFVVIPQKRVAELVDHLNTQRGRHARYVDGSASADEVQQNAEPLQEQLVQTQPNAEPTLPADPARGNAATAAQRPIPASPAKPAATPAPSSDAVALKDAAPPTSPTAPAQPAPSKPLTTNAPDATGAPGANVAAAAPAASVEAKVGPYDNIASLAGGRAQLFGQLHSSPVELTIERANWGLILGQQLPAPPTVQLPERDEDAVTIPIVIEVGPVEIEPAADAPNAAPRGAAERAEPANQQ